MSRRLFEIAFALQGRLDSSFRGAFQNADSQMNRLTRGISDTRNSLRQLDSQYRQGGMSLTQYIAQQERLNGVLRRQQRELQSQERHQQRVNRAQAFEGRINSVRDGSRGAMMDAIAKTGIVAAPIKQAIEFESTFADVKKVVDFDTDGEIAEMKKEIISMTKEIPMSATEFNEIIASGGQANIAKNELTTFAKDAAKMGVAFDMTAQDSGQMMAEWRSAFKINQKEVVELADKVNHLGNKSAASAPKISEVLQRIGPLGEVGGVATGEVAALGAAMVEVGTAPEIAATGLKNLVLKMTAGESATNTQKKAFEKLGLSATDMAKAMQDDAQGAILQVFDSIQKLEEHEQAAILTQLFGSDSVAAIAPLLTDLDRLKELFGMVGDESQYAGSMQAEFEARSATTENSIQLLKNQVAALGLKFGDMLLPALNVVVDKLSAGAEKVQAFADKHPKLTKAIALGTAGMLAMSVAATAIGYAGALMLSPFAKLITLITKLGRAPGILGRIASSMRGIRPPADCGAGSGNHRDRRGRRSSNRNRRNNNTSQSRGRSTRQTRPSRQPRPTGRGGLGGLVRRGASSALNGVRSMGVSGLLKGGAKLGMRAVPILGAGMLAFDVGKFAYNKMGGLQGIKDKFMPKASASELSKSIAEDGNKAVTEATRAGQLSGQSFSQGLAQNMNSNDLSSIVFDQFNNIANGANAYGSAAGFNFTTGIGQNVASNTLSSIVFDQFNNIANGANAYGSAAGFNFTTGIGQNVASNTLSSIVFDQFNNIANGANAYGSAAGFNFTTGIGQNVASNVLSSTVFDQFNNVAIGAAAYGNATGFNYSMGLIQTPIPVLPWIASQVYMPLAMTAVMMFSIGQNISLNLARGISSGRAAIAAEVAGIRSLVAQATNLSVNINAVAKGGRVPKYARGTIATQAHVGIFGEAGPEALIPLDGSARAHDLYQQTGAALGYKNETKIPEAKMDKSTQSITLHYAPVIQGNKTEVETILREDKSSFMDQLKELQAQQRRVTFG
ncbi:hypothetical protein GCM10007425_12760 [Lysinibacillus alkalisoli]|uniref:Phage tail tape measure protein domain-containing protein n=1 Tax=Lysinibacillus alkalisoli TaxID=1911548 RepID=A0A917G2Q0_9BACI|nr:phage tail tape measure protein [Lysinibacillus alkalisoli]GGG19788.1 hypothetical protein GCM10007425_12760 [Lysinibacillus alkalisoli]